METTRNRKLGAVAVGAVALVGVGAALAASKLNSGAHAATAQRGFAAAPQRQGAPPSGGPFGRPGGFDRDGDRRAFGFRGPGGGLSAAATYLGVGETQLFTQLASGKTLAQIANATSGKSASGLIDAMVAAEKSRLAAAVQAGYLTQAMATQIESGMQARVTQLVNGSFRRDRGGFGPPGGSFGQPTPPSQGQGPGGATHI